MGKIALLVVDVQGQLVQGKPYNIDLVLANIKRLITAARLNSCEVIYIRHKGKNIPKDEEHLWDIFEDVKPEENEIIFDKSYNSAFYNTGLKDHLDGQGIETLILVGLLTEYCIDTTCKVAFEYGYDVNIPENTNTTFGNEYLPPDKLYNLFNYKIWDKRFAKVMPVGGVVEFIEGKL